MKPYFGTKQLQKQIAVKERMNPPAIFFTLLCCGHFEHIYINIWLITKPDWIVRYPPFEQLGQIYSYRVCSKLVKFFTLQCVVEVLDK